MESPDIIKDNTRAVWGASPAGTTFALHERPGTAEFFNKVLQKRSTYECPWLADIVNFAQFKEKKVLEIGCGAGYDAYQFCKHQADYTGIDLVPENLHITQQHLHSVGLSGSIHVMDAEYMQFEAAHFDFVYSFGVVHHIPNIQAVLRNIHTVLKDNGRVQLIVYHKHSVFYWLHLVIGDWLLRARFRTMSINERLALIEYTTCTKKPYVKVYSKKELHTLLKAHGFVIEHTCIRKLVKEELPDIPGIRVLYRFIPDSFLAWVGKKFGWYLSVIARKSSL